MPAPNPWCVIAGKNAAALKRPAPVTAFGVTRRLACLLANPSKGTRFSGSA